MITAELMLAGENWNHLLEIAVIHLYGSLSVNTCNVFRGTNSLDGFGDNCSWRLLAVVSESA